MQRKTIVIWFAFMALCLLPGGRCDASFFEMSLERNSIYTPGRMRLVIELADTAAAEGTYTAAISVLAEDTVIRKQLMPVAAEKPAVFELDFPETRHRTNIRCRAELSINGSFMEAREEPLLLWPPLPPIKEPPSDKIIWVFDTSGALQRIFGQMRVNVGDATFQAVRDFQTPEIIFVGENIGRKSFQTLTSRILNKNENLRTIVFFRQETFPEDWPVQALSAETTPRKFSCDPNSSMLSGLNRCDAMNMLRGALAIRITKPKDEQWTLESHISELRKDEEQAYTYLAVVRRQKLATVYCQAPVTKDFDQEPRSALLLTNLLQFACANAGAHNH